MRETHEALSRDYHGAIVIDAATGRVLFADRADARNPPASVTKLMTFYVVAQAIKQGRLSLATRVTIPEAAARMGGSEAWLMKGETATVDQLLYLLMVPSANDAAMALAITTAGSRDAFVARMNADARALGMTHTVYHSPHGLPPGRGQLPDLSTAHDIAKLCRALIAHTDILRYTSTRIYRFRHENGVNNTFTNHNHLLSELPGCDGFKTGWYAKAGYSIAATVRREGRRVIGVVLGCPQRKLRDAIVTRLIERGLAELPPAPAAAVPAPKPAAPGEALIPVPLAPGDRTSLEPKPDAGPPDTVHIDLPVVKH